MLASRAALIGFLLLGLSPSAVHAEEPLTGGEPPVAVLGCPDAWSAELRGLLRLELRTLRQERRDQTRAPLSRVAVECHQARVRIEVELDSGQRSHRWVDTARIDPDARVRTLALTATELVDALWQQPLAPPAPVPAPVEHRPEARASRAAVAPSVHLGGSVRRTGSPGVWLFGALVGAEFPITRALAPVADLRVHLGRQSTDLAAVDVLSLSAASHLLVGSHTGRWRWGAGPGVRLGWVSLHGDPDAGGDHRGEHLDGIWGGPGILGRVTLAPGAGRLLLSLSLDGGLITLPVVGTLDSGSAVFALDGGWAGAALSVGLAP